LNILFYKKKASLIRE